MPFLVKKGTFATNKTGGSSTQAVTGVGFQPKVLILFGTRQITTGTQSLESGCIGVATSTSQRGHITWAADHNVGTANTGKRYSEGALYALLSAGTPTQDGAADLSSFDSDGFTITWGALPSDNFVIHYICLGGSDLTNAKVGAFAQNTATGNQAVTGVGFQPDSILFLSNRITAGGNSANARAMIGVATSTSSRGVLAINDSDNVSPTTCAQVQYTDACLASITTASTDKADLVSFGSDGFTVNWSVANGSTAFRYIYLAIKGGRFKVGNDTQKTSTGTKATTGVGFKPQGLMFFSGCAAANASVDTARAVLSIGATDGTSQGTIWTSSQDAVTTTDTFNDEETNSVLETLAHVGGGSSPTVSSRASISSLDTDGFTLNWGTADATAREFIYIAFGATTYTVGTTDSTTISESNSRALISSRATADTTNVSDSVTRALIEARSVVDSVSISDVNSRTLVGIRSISDSVSISDSNSRFFAPIRPTTDSITISDANDRLTLFVRALSDSLTISDAVDRFLTQSRSVNDSLTISESVGRLFTGSRLISDSINISDSIVRALISTRSLSDSVTITQSGTANLFYPRSTSDSVSISDSIVRNIIYIRTISDSISLVDFISKNSVFYRTISNSTNISDVLFRSLAVSKSISDSVTISDAVGAGKVSLISTNDTINIVDSASKNVVLTIIVLDTVNINDQANYLYNPIYGFIAGRSTTNKPSGLVTSAIKRGKISSRPRLS